MCEQAFLTFSNICILSLFDVLVKDPHRLELIKVTLFKLSSLEPFSQKKSVVISIPGPVATKAKSTKPNEIRIQLNANKNVV